MNIREHIAVEQLRAGGPGSGRHKELIEKQLTGTHIVDGNKTVKGATVRELKNNLRGVVPQDQKKFMSMMDQHGFKTSWSTPSNAWVVHH
jgi:hypothetical protein